MATLSQQEDLALALALSQFDPPSYSADELLESEEEDIGPPLSTEESERAVREVSTYIERLQQLQEKVKKGESTDAA